MKHSVLLSSVMGDDEIIINGKEGGLDVRVDNGGDIVTRVLD